MNSIDIALILYVGSMVLSLILSYTYAAWMTKKVGSFWSHVLLAGIIHLMIGIGVIIGWSLFTFRLNEFVFVLGGLLGVGMIVAGWVALLVALLIRRKCLVAAKESADHR